MKKFLLSAVYLLFSQLIYAQLKTVKYKEGTQNLIGMVNTVSDKSLGAVLILPAWMGIDQEAKDAALALQQEGYFTFIADIYGEGNTPKTPSEAGKIASSYKSDYQAYQRRIMAAIQTFIAQGAPADKLVVMGYCFGGTGALEVARAKFPVRAVVSIHGGLAKGDRKTGPFDTKILVLHGADDANVPAEEVAAFTAEMKQYQTDWQFIIYANAKHTFTNPASKDYNAPMTKRAWQHFTLFLTEVFQ